jgi:hypothetical protein
MAKDTISVYLEYPSRLRQPVFVKICLVDVRAADDIRISYDFERDGCKIEQAQFHEWEAGDAVCDPGWKETAFLPAWPFQGDAS